MKFKIQNIKSNSKLLGYLATGILVAIGGIWLTLHSRAQNAAPTDSTNEHAAAVAPVTREDLSKEVTISAEFRPYVEAKLNAKVSGYVSKMNVDFGDEVKAGQLLATIEVPELAAQLANAEAAARKAEADNVNASLIFTRLKSVNEQHPNLIAQQDLDTAQANDQATTAAIAAAKAEVEKYRTLAGYTNIVAPFDGVVTHRFADPGELIQAGTSSDTQARPLVRVADNYRLRLDFPVTVDYVKDIHVGDEVDVRVDSLDGEILIGKISRFTGEVDDKTRTMTTEIEVPNSDLTVLPGMYATAILKVEKRPNALAVPTEAVSGEKSPVVFVVTRDHQIEQRAVKLGLETPEKFEVLDGLREGELVVIGSHAQFQPGEKVEPKPIQLSQRE
jgi:RND family efflux transporter MFP subunit